MKKVALIIFIFIFSIAKALATPEYIVIYKGWWHGWKMMHVDKPEKKLSKWHYDSKTDTYYRMMSVGIGVRLR